VAIIFIGKEFKFKKFLQNYILSKYRAEKIYFFDTIDFEIDELLSKFKVSLIVTNEQNYPTISKIIATLNNDILELKDGYLIPTKTILYETNSFLISKNENLINLIKVSDFIPNILIDNDKIWTIHIFNYDLETTNIFVKPIFESFNVDYTIYMNEGGWCEIKTSKMNETLLKQLKGFIPHIVVIDNIFEYIILKLKERGEKISFAESCTGGLIASYFTKISGSSNVFDGSVISYANRIKSEWLGVDDKVLDRFGAVSEEVVQQMLLGVSEISDSDYSIAVSGVAGPTGGSEYKPVGTIFIGVTDKKEGKFYVERLQLKGDREQIQYQTMMNAVRILINFGTFL